MAKAAEQNSNGNKQITVAAGDTELNFNVGLTEYNDLINKMTQTNKVAPMHQFLLRCAADDDTKSAVKTYYAMGATLDLAGVLIEEYKPAVEFSVKK